MGLGQIGIKLETKPFIYRNLANLCRKLISMLTCLKVSYLACKCVFDRQKHNAKREPHGIEFGRVFEFRNAEMKGTNK